MKIRLFVRIVFITICYTLTAEEALKMGLFCINKKSFGKCVSFIKKSFEKCVSFIKSRLENV